MSHLARMQTLPLSETGTMSTDLLGSLGPGGEPTRVNRTRDTLLWKKLSQLATLGYFTSERKNTALNKAVPVTHWATQQMINAS